jgi:hypothetical protein
MATDTAPPAGIAGEVMFYKSPEPLNPEAHGRLGLNPSATPFLFAKGSQAVPMIVGEFGPASLSYPIVFAGQECQPLAVMGVRLNENLFIDDNGAFPFGVYVPAFIRRYPFVFATGDDLDQLIVCIDRAADTVAENAQVPFFIGREPSPFTRQCMEFCSNFEAERRKTEEFVKLLKDLDLFVLREVNFTPLNPDGSQGQMIRISEHFSPSEEKVKALPEKTQLDLLRSGAMQQIHLHWNSLLNWERLINDTARRNPIVPPGRA